MGAKHIENGLAGTRKNPQDGLRVYMTPRVEESNQKIDGYVSLLK